MRLETVRIERGGFRVSVARRLRIGVGESQRAAIRPRRRVCFVEIDRLGEMSPRGGSIALAHRQDAERVGNARVLRVQLARVRQGDLGEADALAIGFDEGQVLVGVGIARMPLQDPPDDGFGLVQLLLLAKRGGQRVEQARVIGVLPQGGRANLRGIGRLAGDSHQPREIQGRGRVPGVALQGCRVLPARSFAVAPPFRDPSRLEQGSRVAGFDSQVLLQRGGGGGEVTRRKRRASARAQLRGSRARCGSRCSRPLRFRGGLRGHRGRAGPDVLPRTSAGDHQSEGAHARAHRKPSSAAGVSTLEGAIARGPTLPSSAGSCSSAT